MFKWANRMKKIGIKIVEWHEHIGKILTGCCLFVGLIALVTWITKCGSEDQVIRSNYFLYEPAPVHDENYALTVNSVYSTTSAHILNKDFVSQDMNGFFICLEVALTQSEGSNLKKHLLDTNDFKLKNHTGVYVPLNEIMGALEWDAIDVHIDEDGGGHVMSSLDFSTRNCLKDFNFINQYIEPGKELKFIITFEMDFEVMVDNNITVLEVDFYYGRNGYRKATDIVLLPRPIPLESGI